MIVSLQGSSHGRSFFFGIQVGLFFFFWRYKRLFGEHEGFLTTKLFFQISGSQQNEGPQGGASEGWGAQIWNKWRPNQGWGPHLPCTLYKKKSLLDPTKVAPSSHSVSEKSFFFDMFKILLCFYGSVHEPRMCHSPVKLFGSVTSRS